VPKAYLFDEPKCRKQCLPVKILCNTWIERGLSGRIKKMKFKRMYKPDKPEKIKGRNSAGKIAQKNVHCCTVFYAWEKINE
jgi:hypothetical protein